MSKQNRYSAKKARVDAAEAKQIANQKKDQHVNEILSQVKKAAAKGDYDVTVKYYRDAYIDKQLKSLGYKIERYDGGRSPGDRGYVEIFWKE